MLPPSLVTKVALLPLYAREGTPSQAEYMSTSQWEVHALLLGRKGKGREFFLPLLLFNCLWLKITLMPQGHLLAWRVLIPFTGHPTSILILQYSQSLPTLPPTQPMLLSIPGLSTFFLLFFKKNSIFCLLLCTFYPSYYHIGSKWHKFSCSLASQVLE